MQDHNESLTRYTDLIRPAIEHYSEVISQANIDEGTKKSLMNVQNAMLQDITSVALSAISQDGDKAVRAGVAATLLRISQNIDAIKELESRYKEPHNELLDISSDKSTSESKIKPRILSDKDTFESKIEFLTNEPPNINMTLKDRMTEAKHVTMQEKNTMKSKEKKEIESPHNNEDLNI